MSLSYVSMLMICIAVANGFIDTKRADGMSLLAMRRRSEENQGQQMLAGGGDGSMDDAFEGDVKQKQLMGVQESTRVLAATGADDFNAPKRNTRSSFSMNS